MKSDVAALGCAKLLNITLQPTQQSPFLHKTMFLSIILRAFVNCVSSRAFGSAAVILPVKCVIHQTEGQTPWRHHYSSPICQKLQRIQLVQLQSFYLLSDFYTFFFFFFQIDPQCIHHTMSKNFSSSITTYISSDLNKLIFPDFSHVKLWVERSLSLVGRYAAALVADWLCTLLVIDVGTYRSRQWLQGKAQLSLLQGLLGKVPKVSLYALDHSYG